MENITSKQKAIIRKYAQSIKPLFQIGVGKIHDSNINVIREGFNTKEVIKVRVNREDKYDKSITSHIARELEEKVPCIVAGVIGTTIIIYKENKSIDDNKRVL